MEQYVYFFTRQDISNEQQIVQTAHVALKLGTVYGDLISSANETYFVVIGVRNLEALDAVCCILDKFQFGYTFFREPDMRNEITSIATKPIDENKRGILKAFSLLKL